MENLSTYSILGIPEGVATALVLISLSLVLAPWFGGMELGPLKVPTIGLRMSRVLKYLAPLVLVGTLAAFFPFWPDRNEPSAPEPEVPEIPPGRLLKAAPFRVNLEDCVLDSCIVEFRLKGFDDKGRLRFDHTAFFNDWLTGDFVDTRFSTADTIYFQHNETARFEVFCRLEDEPDLVFGDSREVDWRPWNERGVQGYAVWLSCGNERFRAGVGIGVSTATRRVNEPPVQAE